MIVGVIAFLFDSLVGDPRSSYHPVVLIGKLISFFEKIFYDNQASDRKKFISGMFLTGAVLSVSYLVAFCIELMIRRTGNILVYDFTCAFFLSFMITPKSLAEAGREIYDYLVKGDLKNARYKVGWIVGRDTDNLSPSEATRATVETVSENIVDGIIAPLFFFCLGGFPLAVLYRAANTMDSMVGYKNEKYLYFGRFAARLDDVLNYIPARITAGLIILSAWLLKMDAKAAFKIMKRDAKKHPSPNGGYTEATVAGALGIRLGGLNYYFGKPSFRTYMGDSDKEINEEHIMDTIRLMYTSTVLFLIIMLVLDKIGDLIG